jgi:hypothetical protein
MVPAVAMPSMTSIAPGLATSRSARAAMGASTGLGSRPFHSAGRQLRSTLTGTPAARAASSAASTARAGPSPSTGVMPDTWNQPAPRSAASQSMSPGSSSANAEPARSYTVRNGRRSAPLSTK